MPISSLIDTQEKPYICCVVDTQGWAFDAIAQNIKRLLSDKYRIDIVHTGLFPNLSDLYRNLFIGDKNYDLVHFFWHPNLSSLLDSQILFQATQGFSSTEREAFFWNVSRAYKTTSVYDHLFLGKEETDIATRRTLALSDRYTVSSSSLNEIYSSIDFMKSPESVISDGVDLSVFKPQKILNTNNTSNILYIGWAGNSRWGPDAIDHKGLKTIIKPLVARLKNEGFSVEGRFCDRSVSWRPKEVMPDYYNSIDIYVCASLTEGTPNPVLEAMACGVPILSTDVGIVKDLFGPLQREFIVKDRTSPEFLEKLTKLVVNPELRERLSLENLESVKGWSCESKAVEWDAFFYNTLTSKSKTLESMIKEQAMLLGIWSKGHSQSISLVHKDLEIKNLRKINSELCPELWLLQPKGLQKVIFRFFNCLVDLIEFAIIARLPSAIQRRYCKKRSLPDCYFVFNWWRYLRDNSDLIQANICRGPDAARHWLNFGVQENRILRPHRFIRRKIEKKTSKCSEQANVTIITKVKGCDEILCEQRKSLLLQTKKNFRHFIYCSTKPELSFVDEYRDGRVFKKEMALKNITSSYSHAVYFSKILSQFGSTWFLFLSEDEKLSKPDVINTIIESATDIESIVLWKKGFPGWQKPRSISSKLESSESCLAGFVVNSKHLSKLIWDEFPGAGDRLLMRLIDELRHRWIDDVLTDVNYLDYELTIPGKRADAAMLDSGLSLDFRTVFDLVVFENSRSDNSQMAAFQSESVYSLTYLKRSSLEIDGLLDLKRLTHEAFEKRLLFVRPGAVPLERFLSRFLEVNLHWDCKEEVLAFSGDTQNGNEVLAIAVSSEVLDIIFPPSCDFSFTDLLARLATTKVAVKKLPHVLFQYIF